MNANERASKRRTHTRQEKKTEQKKTHTQESLTIEKRKKRINADGLRELCANIHNLQVSAGISTRRSFPTDNDALSGSNLP